MKPLAILLTVAITGICLAVAYFLTATVLAYPIDSATVTLLYGCVGLLAWIAAHGIWRAWR